MQTGSKLLQKPKKMGIMTTDQKTKKLMRIGKCKRCGDCCQGTFLLKNTDTKVLAKELIDAGMNENMASLIVKDLGNFNCKHLFFTEENGKRIAICAKQLTGKPDFCEAFPAEPGDIVSEHCGFEFVEVEA